MTAGPRRRLKRFLRSVLRGLGWRRGWIGGPRVVPRGGGDAFPGASDRRRPAQGPALGAGGPGRPAREAKADSYDRLLRAVRGSGTGMDFSPGNLARLFDEEPRYSVRAEHQNLRRFTARGDQPRLTQVLLEASRSLTGSLGLVLVEVHGRPREWTAVDVDRSRLLEGLMEIRNLLGGGCLDMAVFSSDESVEVFLDRFATLEIRCGGWHEPRFRSMLEGQGFARVEGLSPLPLSYDGPPSWSDEDGGRVEDVCRRLGLEAVTDAPDATDAG